jgi:hypothetical protein
MGKYPNSRSIGQSKLLVKKELYTSLMDNIIMEEN